MNEHKKKLNEYRKKIKIKLIIISSPSGAGKTTICKYLLKKDEIIWTYLYLIYH